MEQAQTVSVVQASIELSSQTQDEAHRKMALEIALLEGRRRLTWFAIAGIAIGVSFTYFNGNPLNFGVFWGGISASAFGWLVTSRVKA